MKDIMSEEFRVLDIEETNRGWIGKYYERVGDDFQFRCNIIADEPTRESFVEEIDALMLCDDICEEF